MCCSFTAEKEPEAEPESEPSALKMLHDAKEVKGEWESTLHEASEAEKDAEGAAERAANDLSGLQDTFDVSKVIFLGDL